MDDQWIIVLGNVVDGVNIYGPFVDYEEACAFGGDSGLEWHATILNSPKPSKSDITSEGAPIHIASHAYIYLDEEREYVLSCPNIHAAMKAGRDEKDVLASIVGPERS